MRLAFHFGLPLDELRSRFTPFDLVRFHAMTLHDGPWWGQRDDVLAARLQATVVAAAGVSDVRPSQFLVDWGGRGRDRVEMTFEEALPILQARYG